MKAFMSANGDLTIVGTEPIETYALIQWEKMRKAGKARLIIDEESEFKIDDLNKIMKEHAELVKVRHEEFKEFLAQKDSAQKN